MCRDFRRPRYTYEAGKTLFGNIETNADFVFAQKKGNRLNYTIVNFTKAFYKGESLYEAKSGYFGLAFDGSPDTQGVGKVRYRRDQAILNDSK
jgi:hypothetical protein